MPSSISSSEATSSDAVRTDTGISQAANSATAMHAEGIVLPERFERPGFVRLTASDRPGVAQPVPERDIPQQPWGRIVLGALLLFLVLMTLWEWHWRDFGNAPSYRNSDGAWAEQRRRINQGEGGATVLIGASRTLFDVQLDEWQQVTGERPIQLALEGTSPVPVLEDLAADADFTGKLVVDLSTNNIFFGMDGIRAETVGYYHKQSPSQRSGHWLSQQLLEPYFAFDDPDFALAKVLRRQSFWPARERLPPAPQVRKLAVSGRDRDTHMWRKVETDPAYRQVVQDIWRHIVKRPPPPMADTPDKARQVREKQIDRIVAATDKLRARGVRVVFLRPPSTGPWYELEQRVIPRHETWDVVLRRARAPGVHFEDHAQLQGLDLPEWSHLSHADAKRFTVALAPLLEQGFAQQEQARPAATQHVP